MAKKKYNLNDLFGDDTKIKVVKNTKKRKEKVKKAKEEYEKIDKNATHHFSKQNNKNNTIIITKLNTRQEGTPYFMGPPKPPKSTYVKGNKPYGIIQELADEESANRRLRFIAIIILMFIAIGGALQIFKLNQEFDEVSQEYYYTETPLDKGKEILQVVSESGQELSEFLKTWPENLKIKNKLVTLPLGIQLNLFSSIWNWFVDTPVFKIIIFVFGGVYEIGKIIIKGTITILN